MRFTFVAFPEPLREMLVDLFQNVLWATRSPSSPIHGRFNGDLAWQAHRMGFESAASTLPGAWHQSGELWWLHRQRVSASTSLAGFAWLVGGPRP